jgi:hypothetical protein
VSLEELISIGKDRVDSGHLAVICNRGEDFAKDNGSSAYLVTVIDSLIAAEGKQEIAKMVANCLSEFYSKT